MFLGGNERKVWEPTADGEGPINTKVAEATAAVQALETHSGERARGVSRKLKSWGFGGSLAAILSMTVASALMPPILPAAAATYLAATEAVSGAILPTSLGVMIWGQIKDWINGFTLRKRLASNTSNIFRSKRRVAQPATA